MSAMKTIRPASFFPRVTPNSPACFTALMKSPPESASAITSALEACACNRKDEKSGVLIGCFTAPTTLPPPVDRRADIRLVLVIPSDDLDRAPEYLALEIVDRHLRRDDRALPAIVGVERRHVGQHAEPDRPVLCGRRRRHRHERQRQSDRFACAALDRLHPGFHRFSPPNRCRQSWPERRVAEVK